MAGDVPLLERLAQLPAVPVEQAIGLIDNMPEPGGDPVIGPLFGTDDEGNIVVNPPSSSTCRPSRTPPATERCSKG